MTTRPDSGQPIGWESALIALGVGVVRGGNQVAIKFALTAFPPLWSAFARMAVSMVTVSFWAKASGRELLPTKPERAALALLGAVFAVQIGMLHVGADLTSPAYAVILINTNPIFANLIAHFVVPEDRLSPQRTLGLAMAFGGVCSVFLGRPDLRLAPNPVLGNLLVTLSAAMVAGRTVYIQRLVQRMEPAKAMFWQMGVSLPLFAAGSVLRGEGGMRSALGGAPLLAIVYQGVIVGGVALIAWVLLLRRHTPGSVTAFSFATPIAGVFLSALLFREELTAGLFGGMAAVLAGVWLVTRRPASPANEAEGIPEDIG